jgi:predicted AlkP superfamily phosphohydrolase/phosphomutase
MTVFLAMDRVQHFFWKNIDDAHPHYQRTNLTEKARDVMTSIDHYVGEIADITDENTLLIVLSDHGFCPIHTEIYLNNYLETHGLITRQNGEIDDIQTEARAYGYGDIWLNLVGREPAGTIKPGEPYDKLLEKIISHLNSLTIRGEKPVKAVKKREEIYNGPETDKAPDLTAIFNPGWQAARRPDILPREQRQYINEDPRWSGGHDGTHDPHDVPGILIINGSNVGTVRNLEAELTDLAPTILKTLGKAVPEYMDGRPLDT